VPADTERGRNITQPNLQAKADAWHTELLRRAEEIEINRKLPQDLANRLAGDGFYALCTPVCLGGTGATPRDYALSVETLARADASAAWCAFIATTASYGMATRRTDVFETLLKQPDVIMAGVFAPMGRARPVNRKGEAGFIVNGRWAWGSGSQNAHWIMGGCLLSDDEGAPVLDGKGKPQHLAPVFKSADVTFIDTWKVSGLQGTGSTDFEVNDVFVPEDRIVRDFENARDDLAIFRFPGFGLLAIGIASVALGAARGAMDDVLELAGVKAPSGSRNTLAAKVMAHRGVSEAEAAIRQGRAFLLETICAAWQAAQSGPVSIDLKRDLRLACTSAVRSAISAVDTLYDLAGGTAVYRTSPIQRRFRDIHVASQHIMVQKGIFDLTGKLYLDQPTDTGLL